MSLLEEWNLDDALAFARKEGVARGEVIGEAIGILHVVTGENRSIYEIVEITGLAPNEIVPYRFKWDVITKLLREWNLDTALVVARKEGEARSEKRKALKIASKMKARGDTIDEIIEITGLTVDDVLRL